MAKRNRNKRHYLILLLCVIIGCKGEKINMQKLRFVNANGVELDLTSGHYGITNWNGFSNANLNLQTQQVPYQDGSVFIDGLLNNRELSVTLCINDNNDLAKRYELRNELIKTLNPKLGEGYLYYKNDFLERRIKVIPQLPVIPNKNSNESGTVKASLSWTACGVYWEDVEETSIELEEGKRKIINNEGDIPCAVKIEADLNYAELPSIKNLSNGNKIELIENLGDVNISIDTNLGHKQISKKSINLGYVSNNSLYISPDSINICNDNDNIYILSAQLCLVSNDKINLDIFKTSVPGDKPLFIYSSKLNKFISYANNSNKFIFTKDFKTWTEKEEVFDSNVKKIMYIKSKDLFYVFTTTKIYTSEDFETWTEFATTNINFAAVVFAENINEFCGIYNSKIYSSEDFGETWTERYSSTGNLTYSEERQIFINVHGYVDKTVINYSNDAINWNSIELSLIGFREINFISDYNCYITCSTNKIYKSNDLITWVEIFNFNSENWLQIYSYVNSLGLFIFLGTNTLLITSNDLENFNLISSQDNIIQVAHNPVDNIYVACDRHEIIYKSNNGVTFEKVYSVNENYRGMGVAYNTQDRIFGVIFEHGRLLVSEDNGTTWTQAYYYSGDSFSSIVYDDINNQFLIAGQSGIYRYKNGAFASLSSINCYYVNYDKFSQKYIISASDGMYITEDLQTLTKINSFVTTRWAVNDKRQYIACGRNVYFSSDGSIWSQAILPQELSSTYNYVNYDSVYRYFILSSDNNILCSKNGINWSVLYHYPAANNYFYNFFRNSKNEIIVPGYMYFLKITETEEQSVISKLSSDSNLSFNLEPGENEILLSRFSGNINGTLTYRQKYLGV